MDFQDFAMNDQRSKMRRTSLESALATGAGSQNQQVDLNGMDFSQATAELIERPYETWPNNGDGDMFISDPGVAAGGLAPDMAGQAEDQTQFAGQLTSLTGVAMSMCAGALSYQATYPETSPPSYPVPDQSSVWQQEGAPYEGQFLQQVQQAQQLQQAHAQYVQPRLNSDPQWTLALHQQQLQGCQMPVRPRSDPEISMPNFATDYEGANYRQAAAGPFRPYDHPHGDVFPPQHQRQDSKSSNAAAKVAIPKNGSVALQRDSSNPSSPPTTSAAAMTAARSGPMSKEVEVKPRPRPGRKPMEGADKEDRRRLQNRMAQRAFRDKRAQKNNELEHEINRMKSEFQAKEAENRNRMAELQAECQDKDRKLAELRAEAATIRASATAQEQRIAELERQLKMVSGNVGLFRDATGHSANSHPPSVPTPPESTYEIDFTNYGRTTGSTYGLRNTLSNDSSGMEFSVDNEDPCGFCTDEQNCACKQEAQGQRPKPTPLEPKVSTTLPGSCDMCQSDPERARACREMAAATRPAGGDTTRRSSSFGSRSSMINSSMPPPRMSCSAMVDQFNKFGERTSSIGGLFGGRRLNAYPREHGGGFDFEEAQAAEVLSTLHRRSEGAASTSSFANSQSGESPSM